VSYWVEDGDDRWVRDDDHRHLLLHADGRFVEHEGGYVHRYDGDLGPAGNPLGDAAWVGTFDRPDLNGVAVEQLWRVMGEYTRPAP
jgi:hypothetical protein